MEKNPITGLPEWLDKYNPVPLEWNGLRVYFAVLPVSKIKMNKGQIEGLPANPRRWDKEELERLKRSIVETPELTLARGVLAYPLDGEVVALGGNMRRHSANLEPKESALPCYIYPPETPADKLLEIVIKDNGAFGEWDMDALANEFHDKPLVAWGVPAWEQRNAEQAQNGTGGSGQNKDHQCDNQEDNTDGMQVEKRASMGAIFRLGEHVLMCGDATSRDDVSELLKCAGVADADLALTDPPYGIDVVKKKERLRTSVGDSKEPAFRTGIGSSCIIKARNYMRVAGDDSTDTARAAVGILSEKTDNQVIFGGNYFTDFLRPSRCWVVWDKVNGESDFADVELAWCSLDKSARMFRHMWNGMSREGDVAAEGRTRLHPTQKPVGLLTAIVEKLFPDVQTILDPFGGSGSTLIACERLKKRCFMMELSPDYCDVILARWERFSGKKAELLNAPEKAPENEE